jgi:hypothetical protein
MNRRKRQMFDYFIDMEVAETVHEDAPEAAQEVPI